MIRGLVISTSVITLMITFGIITYGFTSQIVDVRAEKNIDNSTFKAIARNVSVLIVHPEFSKIGYIPDTLDVPSGTTVTWTNNDSTLHTVTSGRTIGEVDTGKDFDSGLIDPGKFFQHSFNSTGIFDYHCELHPYLVGKVRVN